MSGTDTASPGRSEIDTIARKGNSVNSPMMIRGMWIRFRRTFIEVGTLRRATCPEGRGVNGGRWPERLSKGPRSEEHTSELQSRGHLVCRLLLEQKKKILPYD